MAGPAGDTLFAVVGAGPSLDYSRMVITNLIAAGAHFLLSDSIAAAFLRLYPHSRTTVFTVELRRHAYLTRICRISRFDVLAYAKAHERNLRVGPACRVTRFKLRGESGDFIELYSPGTVLGVMLSYAVTNARPEAEIHVIGGDFTFIDNQVYARFIDPHAPQVDRLRTREHWQYEMALKKTGGLVMKSGIAVRTSFELMQARENMRAFVDALPPSMRVIEYSPIGFETERIEKRLP
ncbi:MAG: hypothetical protein J0L53_06235 [Spirochaetes bacterium]|nr:hypothetical protein [Spirochaetota bacterium]